MHFAFVGGSGLLAWHAGLGVADPSTAASFIALQSLQQRLASLRSRRASDQG